MNEWRQSAHLSVIYLWCINFTNLPVACGEGAVEFMLHYIYIALAVLIIK